MKILHIYSNRTKKIKCFKKNDKMIVDLGTGNAPIPLYMSLNTDADIYGFEIQKKSYDLALKSVKINNKEGQIHIINDDIKNASKLLGAYKADVVVTNPPFFKYIEGKSNINKNDEKTIVVSMQKKEKLKDKKQ